jgi:hypothetical protein
MIDFSRSTFTWKSQPWKADPYYRWQGGFVGTVGQVYQVRFTLDARCHVHHDDSGESTELFLGAPCRSEYTIARRNLFQIPSGEWRMAFSERSSVSIARCPGDDTEEATTTPLDRYQDYEIDVRRLADASELRSTESIVKATLAKDLLNGLTVYRDQERGFTVTVEYPVNVMNLNEADGEFQICTGPVILPDLSTWDGHDVGRVFLAHVAVSGFDHAEFVLRREIDAAEAEREWLDRPRGRDRLELRDPDIKPTGYPPERPKPTAYNEIWEVDADNAVLRSGN